MRYRLPLYVSAISSAIYLASQNWQPFPGSVVIKGCAVGALALLALQVRAVARDARLLALALGLSAAGDVLLDLDPRLFAFGLAAFLLAHLVYIALFTRNRARPFHPGLPRVSAVLAILAGNTALASWIVPAVDGLAIPVVLYICAITAMVSLAILARFEKLWVPLGAVLFLISDSLLAVNKFKTAVPLHEYLIWTTYYLGQCGIALGFLGSGKNVPLMAD